MKCIVATRGGQYIASCRFPDIKLRIWVLNGTGKSYTLEGHRRAITSIVFSNDAKYVYSSDRDWTVRVWGLGYNNYQNIVLTHHNRFIENLSITSNDEHFVFLTDRTIEMWNIRERKQVIESSGYWDSCKVLAIRNDNRFLVSIGRSNMLKIWRLPEQSELGALQVPCFYSPDIAVTSNNKYMVLGSMGATARVWRLQEKYKKNLIRVLV